MYQINREASKPGYCVLSRPQGLKGFGKGLNGCLTILLLFLLIPVLAGFTFWGYLELKQADYIGLLIPVSLTLLLFAVRWLIIWPKIPARLVLDSSTRQIHILDHHDDVVADCPAMSYNEINSIVVHEELNLSEEHHSKRYKIVLQKNDTSSWLLLDAFTGRAKAEQALYDLLELMQWSPNLTNAPDEAQAQRQSSETDIADSSYTLGHWHLPKSLISSENFNFERLDELSKITWQTKHPPGRKTALSITSLALNLLAIGLSSYSLMFKLFAVIPLGIALLIFKSLRHWHSRQEIRIYRDRIELSSKTVGELITLRIDELKCLAFDLSDQSLQLRFVKHQDFEYMSQLKTRGNQITFEEALEAMKIILKSTQVYVAYMNASDILRLEALIQTEVHYRTNHHLT